jgi:bifunctional non-homologous end joining protein LigD
MSLSEYQRKRSFNHTPEPKAKKASSGRGALHFVVQKHHASHLHYDFRLEMNGVLKSWAVPKGPSMNPAVKRLAMMVEDHPFDYRNFEGIIPEGNYGAGTVIIWDEGTYVPAEHEQGTKKEKQAILLKELAEGRLSFILNGYKLKGKFALVKTPHRAENAWLLMKLKDEYATEEDITAEEQSVRSGKTLEQIASSKK